MSIHLHQGKGIDGMYWFVITSQVVTHLLGDSVSHVLWPRGITFILLGESPHFNTGLFWTKKNRQGLALFMLRRLDSEIRTVSRYCKGGFFLVPNRLGVWGRVFLRSCWYLLTFGVFGRVIFHQTGLRYRQIATCTLQENKLVLPVLLIRYLNCPIKYLGMENMVCLSKNLSHRCRRHGYNQFHSSPDAPWDGSILSKPFPLFHVAIFHRSCSQIIHTWTGASG